MRGLIGAISALAIMASSAASAESLKLVEVITSPERTKVLQQQVEAFEAANPGTEVEIVSLPWGQAFEKFATMVAGETFLTWSKCRIVGPVSTRTSWLI